MDIEATHLGKKSNYPRSYDPSVLVAVPRKLNRGHLGITENNLPFSGVDVWHIYEFSFLTKKGLPVAGILKLVYSAMNEFLVESKSLKLYMNSFNMEQLGLAREPGVSEALKIIKSDLSKLLECEVQVSFFDHKTIESPAGFEDFSIIESTIDENNLECTEYNENPNLLICADIPGEIKWGTHLLRSNCKITYQPDWGSVYLYMKGDKLPTPESFLRYIVSLRNENHFHEEICETIFKRLTDRFQPECLSVTCLYTRRGGIDICPVRVTPTMGIPGRLFSPSEITKTTFRR